MRERDTLAQVRDFAKKRIATQQRDVDIFPIGVLGSKVLRDDEGNIVWDVRGLIGEPLRRLFCQNVRGLFIEKYPQFSSFYNMQSGTIDLEKRLYALAFMRQKLDIEEYINTFETDLGSEDFRFLCRLWRLGTREEVFRFAFLDHRIYIGESSIDFSEEVKDRVRNRYSNVYGEIISDAVTKQAEAGMLCRGPFVDVEWAHLDFLENPKGTFLVEKGSTILLRVSNETIRGFLEQVLVEDIYAIQFGITFAGRWSRGIYVFTDQVFFGKLKDAGLLDSNIQ